MAGKLHGFAVRIDNRLRGAFGETDLSKRTIRINKKKHSRTAQVKHLTPNKDGSENILTTLVHEGIHAKNPKKKEGPVEKLARAMVSKMSTKTKARYYSKLT